MQRVRHLCNCLMPRCLQSDMHEHWPGHQAQTLCAKGSRRALHAERSANGLFWAAEGQNMSMAVCESAIQQHPTSCLRGYGREVSTGCDTASWCLLMQQGVQRSMRAHLNTTSLLQASACFSPAEHSDLSSFKLHAHHLRWERVICTWLSEALGLLLPLGNCRLPCRWLCNILQRLVRLHQGVLHLGLVKAALPLP